jgi:ABC-type bacteriocin/lantibiotic exporter with double-glycine peptidase domain
MRALRIPYRRQKNDYYCGPAVLQMVFAYYGMRIPQPTLAKELKTTRKAGSARAAMKRAAAARGFVLHARSGARIGDIRRKLAKGIPVIVNYVETGNNEGHYAVVTSLSQGRIRMQDPYHGAGFTMDIGHFVGRWHNERKTVRRWMMDVCPPAPGGH